MRQVIIRSQVPRGQSMGNHRRHTEVIRDDERGNQRSSVMMRKALITKPRASRCLTSSADEDGNQRPSEAIRLAP